MSFTLQNELMHATSRDQVAGVYWASRDIDPAFLGNHHFFIFMYKDEEQAKRVTGRWDGWHVRYRREVNDAGLAVYFTTVGVGTDSSDNIKYKFNPESDIWAINEIAKESNTDALSPDKDLQAVRLSPDVSSHNIPSYEDLMNALLGRIFNFNKNREMGNTITYHLFTQNCSAGVNTVLSTLGFPDAYREQMGEFSGIDMAEESIVAAELYSMAYVGNKHSLELHATGCEYVSRMLSSNKVNFTSIFDALDRGYNGCAYCMKQFDTDRREEPQKLFKLHLIGLVCNETEDWSGADSAYLRVNGIRVWGPVRMNNGDAKVLTDVPPIEFTDVAGISLFDKDSGASFVSDDVPLDGDDSLGKVSIPASLAGQGEKSCVFKKDGAHYLLIYKVVEYDVNTGEAVPGTTYQLFLESLKCHETEDFIGADETYMRANNVIVWGPKSMNDGNTRDLTGLDPLGFQGSVRLDLYDKDGDMPSDDDDHLGHFLVTPAVNGQGTQSYTFDGDGSRYVLKYHVGEQSPVTEPADYRLKLISLTCHDTEDSTGADETYLHVDRVLKWGPRSMNDGNTKSLAGIEPIRFQNSVRLDLYDQDSGSWYDSDDHIDKVIISTGDSGRGTKECKFKGDGASYTLKYEVLS
ncbi:MAG: hypothetical protein OQK67_04280 [Chlorobium sp.]|nr:hypothetical protein [Chlorobium sp.]